MAMFDQNSATPNQEEDLSNVTLDDFVGEGKKYATVEDLVKGFAHSQSHIGRLESENQDLRTKAEAKIQAEDFLRGLQQQGTQQPEHNNTPSQDPDNGGNQEVDIETLVAEKIAASKAADTAESNKLKVTSALSEKFGSRAGEMFAAKAKELGVDLEALSAQSPELVLQSFGVGASAPSNSASLPTGDKRASNLNDGITAEEGTKAYYQQLRKAGRLTKSQYYQECNAAISRDARKFNS